MIELEDIAYVRSGVADLPAAVRFGRNRLPVWRGYSGEAFSARLVPQPANPAGSAA